MREHDDKPAIRRERSSPSRNEVWRRVAPPYAIVGWLDISQIDQSVKVGHTRFIGESVMGKGAGGLADTRPATEPPRRTHPSLSVRRLCAVSAETGRRRPGGWRPGPGGGRSGLGSQASPVSPGPRSPRTPPAPCLPPALEGPAQRCSLRSGGSVQGAVDLHTWWEASVLVDRPGLPRDIQGRPHTPTHPR